MDRVTIRAVSTWHFVYLIIGSLFFIAMGPCVAILSNEPIISTVFCVMGSAIAFAVWWATGSLITGKCVVSEKGLEYSCWFGLRNEVYCWQDCIGFGLLQTPNLLYGIKWLYFSDRWMVEGYSPDGYIEWMDSVGIGGRPKIGHHYCQIQYTAYVLGVLKEYMPPEMFDKMIIKE